MYMIRKIRYCYDDSFQQAALPSNNGRTSMVAVSEIFVGRNSVSCRCIRLLLCQLATIRYEYDLNVSSIYVPVYVRSE